MKQKRFKGEKFEIASIWGDSLTFPQHTHEEYVISCNLSGNEKLTLDGRAHEAPESFTTLYNPGQVQGGDGTQYLISLYLEPNFFQTELNSSTRASFIKPIVDDADLHQSCAALVKFTFIKAQYSDVEEYVFNVLDIITSRYMSMSQDNIIDKGDWRVKKVKEILLDDLSSTPSLNELAHQVSLNKLALLRMFSNATGIPPITWQRHKRVAKARELLNKGMSAAQTACEMGFADQAHMTRQFTSAYGISPARFAQR